MDLSDNLNNIKKTIKKWIKNKIKIKNSCINLFGLSKQSNANLIKKREREREKKMEKNLKKKKHKTWGKTKQTCGPKTPAYKSSSYKQMC